MKFPIGVYNLSAQRKMETFYGVLHECTHDPKFEKQFEDHEFEDLPTLNFNPSKF